MSSFMFGFLGGAVTLFVLYMSMGLIRVSVARNRPEPRGVVYALSIRMER